MSFILRKYQEEACDALEAFYRNGSKKNAIAVLMTGSGKSLIIANTIKRLGEPMLVFQPTIEILEQNHAKLLSYGYNAGIYSASAGKKQISEITLATIGSVVGKPELFKQFKYMLVDECHQINAKNKNGMYSRFIHELGNTKIGGVTATPYRLSTDGFGGSKLKFLTRTQPRVFHDMIYYVQPKYLFDEGFLCPLVYYSIPGFDSSILKSNSTGADYDDESVKAYYKQINFPATINRVVESLLKVRKNILIFTRYVHEAEFLAATIPGIAVLTAKTPKKERARIFADFKSGVIKGLANVGIATTGFDFPELETVVLARPTMSLMLYSQMIGRGTRTALESGKKDCWIIDMGDNLRLFGRVEDQVITKEPDSKYELWYIQGMVEGKVKKLTNEYFER